MKKRKLVFFLVLAGVLIAVSLLAPQLCPNDPNATSAAAMNHAPARNIPSAPTATGGASARAC
jgi:hypothetical protein